MYWDFRNWLHHKYNIHYWDYYNVTIRNEFRRCYICDEWERYNRAKKKWEKAMGKDD